MYAIDEKLIVRIGMNRRHHTTDDTEFAGQHFGYRSQAVRRTRTVRNNTVFFRIVRFFIDTHDDGRIRIFARRRNDDAFGTACQMFGCRFAVFEFTCRFDYYIYTQFFPGNISRIRMIGHGNAAPVNNQFTRSFIV